SGCVGDICYLGRGHFLLPADDLQCPRPVNSSHISEAVILSGLQAAKAPNCIAQLDSLGGTFAPFLRASESPIAIACSRLFTLPPLPPLPERSVPRFFRRMALATVLPAALPYLRPPDFFPELFFAAI